MTPDEIKDNLIRIQKETGGISEYALKVSLLHFEEAIRSDQKERDYIAYKQYLGEAPPEQSARLKRFILTT